MRSVSVLDRPVRAEAAVAFGLCILLGSKLSPLPFAPYAGVLGLVVLPVLMALRSYRGLPLLAALLATSVLSGIVLTVAFDDHTTLPSVMIGKSAMVVAFIGSLAVVAYARTAIGAPFTAIAYGLGMLIAAVLAGPASAGGWRFTYSIPVAVLVLGLLSLRASLPVQIAGLLLLAGIGFVNDSRSNSAMLVLAAVVLMWQRLARVVNKGRRRVGNVLGVLLFGAGVFQLIQFSLLEGFFGAATQAKTSRQIEMTGSLLLGGRPEAAASFALVRLYPFGIGSGSAPRMTDVTAAKASMLSVG